MCARRCFRVRAVEGRLWWPPSCVSTCPDKIPVDESEHRNPKFFPDPYLVDMIFVNKKRIVTTYLATAQPGTRWVGRLCAYP